ncbi:MAG: LysM peptidoglycan-binding domain-containing protein [Phycisphaerae bacterium]|nr:LysM peptidoglycan-binding domain-containing protein [Phycisphaerae bacterium]NIP54818.1 LysM peptidoglycan-binding domain-containing protein [Phycisphaerae bacterium]NIX30874.1 LysM peptidoglycan-binding domain-containing protein [Phycisphaerae bacterium]
MPGGTAAHFLWAIAEANRIYNTNLIYRGQVLCIP